MTSYNFFKLTSCVPRNTNARGQILDVLFVLLLPTSSFSLLLLLFLLLLILSLLLCVVNVSCTCTVAPYVMKHTFMYEGILFSVRCKKSINPASSYSVSMQMSTTKTNVGAERGAKGKIYSTVVPDDCSYSGSWPWANCGASIGIVFVELHNEQVQTRRYRSTIQYGLIAAWHTLHEINEWRSSWHGWPSGVYMHPSGITIRRLSLRLAG